MSYTPQPGTASARALAHLQSLPKGTWLTSAVLAEAMGVTTETLKNLLEHGLRKGAFTTRPRRDGMRGLEWALNDGSTPPPAPPDDDDDEGGIDLKVTGAAPVVADVKPWPFAFPAQNLKHEAPSAEIVAPVPAPAAPAAVEPTRITQDAADFACALFNDGRLLLEIGTSSVTLAKCQTRTLVRYLERMATEAMA